MDENALMNQPPGFHGSTNDRVLVHKLHKALCGFKQASKTWFDRQCSFLPTMGF